MVEHPLIPCFSVCVHLQVFHLRSQNLDSLFASQAMIPFHSVYPSLAFQGHLGEVGLAPNNVCIFILRKYGGGSGFEQQPIPSEVGVEMGHGPSSTVHLQSCFCVHTLEYSASVITLPSKRGRRWLPEFRLVPFCLLCTPTTAVGCRDSFVSTWGFSGWGAGGVELTFHCVYMTWYKI